MAGCQWEPWKCERDSKALQLASKAELREASCLPQCDLRLWQGLQEACVFDLIRSRTKRWLSNANKAGRFPVCHAGGPLTGSPRRQGEKCERSVIVLQPDNLKNICTTCFGGLTQHTSIPTPIILLLIATLWGLLVSAVSELRGLIQQSRSHTLFSLRRKSPHCLYAWSFLWGTSVQRHEDRLYFHILLCASQSAKEWWGHSWIGRYSRARCVGSLVYFDAMHKQVNFSLMSHWPNSYHPPVIMQWSSTPLTNQLINRFAHLYFSTTRAVNQSYCSCWTREGFEPWTSLCWTFGCNQRSLDGSSDRTSIVWHSIWKYCSCVTGNW